MGWGIHKIHYLDFLDEAEKVNSSCSAEDEQNQKHSYDTSSKPWMVENIFLKM